MQSRSRDRSPTVRRRSVLASASGAFLFGLAGCLDVAELGSSGGGGPLEEFVLAATVRDDPDDVGRDYAPLAEWIERQTDTPTRIDPVQDDGAAISALAVGHAHAAYLSGGPAWVGWQEHDLEAIVAEVDEDGRASYTAAAWVRAESDLEELADLAGVDSCHTGDLTGAGMLIPTAALAHEGLVSFDDDDDVTAIRAAVETFFGDPVVGGGYVGALQCLSAGHGDVGFMRASTPTDYCGGTGPETWCLPMDEYELLAELAEVPSHPVMVGPDVSEGDRERLQAALLALNDDPEGQSILEEVLGVTGLEATTAQEHLGPYGELIEVLPGIEDHLVE